MPSVTFLPDGKRTEVKESNRILDAALSSGVELASICGGRGFCGKCQVVIHDEMENLSPLNDMERKHLSEEKIQMGYRLACCAKIQGNVVVKIPEASRVGRQKLVIMGVEPRIDFEPAIKKVHLTLQKPTLKDPLADDYRIVEALRKIGISNVVFDYEILKLMSQIIRNGDFDLTVTLHDNKIIDIEPGDSTKGAFGFAVDIGTTKVAGFLIDLMTGNLMYAAGVMNPQIPFGEDLISRISYIAVRRENLAKLQRGIVQVINELIENTCKICNVEMAQIYELSVAGNTAMHHIFLGIDPVNLSRSPYVPSVMSSLNLKASEIGIKINPRGNVYLLPNIAGFVGADAVGDVLATNLCLEEDICLLVDIGTNTEVMLGNKDGILACSTPSGPVFEGAFIKSGMRAATGAIERAQIDPHTLKVDYTTIDEAKPRGICGSGIIDLVAEMLKVGVIDTTGSIQKNLNNSMFYIENNIPEFIVVPKEETAAGMESITVTQKDVREVQKAKAAIHSACSILLKRLQISENNIKKILVAGAFGSYIDPTNAISIGMLPEVPINIIKFVGNTAGSGARMALKSRQIKREADRIPSQVRYVELAAELDFHEEYINSLDFPHADIGIYPETMKIIKAHRVSKIYKKRVSG